MFDRDPNLYVHQQGRYFSKFFLFAGFMMILVPAILATIDILWPILLVPFGLLIFIPIQQFEIDLLGLRCRDCTNVLGKKFGEWKSIDGVQCITLAKKRYTWNRTSGLMGMDSTEDEFFSIVARFYFDERNRLEIDEFETKLEALKGCKGMAEALKIPLIDTTSTPHVRYV